MILPVGEAWVESVHKRAMDLALSTALLPVGAPLAAGAAALIRTVDGVDPLYAHERPGLNEEPFTIYKLRTMPGEKQEVQSVGGFRDQRASKIGRFLRKVRLDEVPQLYNIYRGEMSVVGPRPVIKSEYEEIMDSLNPSDQKQWRWARSICRPGMIDSFGIRAYQENYDLHTTERVEADIDYATNASFRGDMRLITTSLGLFGGMFGKDEAEPKVHEYKRGGRALSLAARALGVQVLPQEEQYWGSVFPIVRILDNLVDCDGVSDLRPVVTQLFNGKPSSHISAELTQQFITALQSTFNPADQNNVADALNSIPHYAQRKLSARTATQLAEVALDEARCFASILLLPEQGTDVSERERFNKWLMSVAQAGEAFDTAVDMRKDFREGTINIKPKVTSSVTIAFSGARHARQALRGLDWHTKKQLASCARACLQDS